MRHKDYPSFPSKNFFKNAASVVTQRKQDI